MDVLHGHGAALILHPPAVRRQAGRRGASDCASVAACEARGHVPSIHVPIFPEVPVRLSIALPLFLVLLPVCASAIDDPAWPMYQGGPGHTGFLDRDLMLDRSGAGWSTELPLPVNGIAIGDGQIYVTPNGYFAEQSLIVLELETGAEAWTKSYPDVFSVNPVAYDQQNGRIYLQTGNHSTDTFLRAYETNGDFAWRTAFAAQWEEYLAPTIIGDSVYINGGYYGGAYGFARSDGLEEWHEPLAQYDTWTPTQYGNDKLVVYTNQLQVLERATGAVLSTIPIPDYDWGGYTVAQTPVLVGNIAYVTNGGRLFAFDLVAEELAWSIDTNAFGQVSTDGSQLALIESGALSVRDAATGAYLWGWEASGGSGLRPQVLLFRHHIIVATGESTYVVDRRTHREVASWPMGGLLAYGDGHLLIGAELEPAALTAIQLPSTPFLRDGFESPPMPKAK